MSDKLRILVTGFGPFPGAPYNPTQPLVARLMRLRRPAFTDVELSSHIWVRSAQTGVALPGEVDCFAQARATLDGTPQQPSRHQTPVIARQLREA